MRFSSKEFVIGLWLYMYPCLLTMVLILWNGGKLLGRLILWLLWDQIGFRFVFQKMFPPKDERTGKRMPATLFIWMLGIYVALFGIASNRYENKIDKIETQAAILHSQLASKAGNNAFRRLARIQKETIPHKPELISWDDPFSVFKSLWGEEEPFYSMIEDLKGTVEEWKGDLVDADLQEAILCGADLQEAKLWDANLQEAKLWDTDLRGAKLQHANLERADLQRTDLKETNLQGAHLQETDLRGTDLRGTDLSGANLRGVNLMGAILQGANLKGAKNLTVDQLCQAKTLYQAEMEPNLLEAVKKECPELLEESSTN
ncbi:MAG: pentapeptide repeat-containing protein [Anaerolineaceae bacterium]|nr:pentapeptide repeat-containing protein [Anaerolineaceae bacterium]